MMKRGLKIFLTLFFLTVFLYSGYRLVSALLDYRQSSSAYDIISQGAVSIGTATSATQATNGGPVAEGGISAETVEATESAESAPTGTTYVLPAAPDTPADEREVISIDFAELKAINQDIVAWLYSPETVISYPVLQSKDNVDYLRTLPDGSYNGGGSLFIDYRCSGFSGLNTIVYGHNRSNGSMFHSLVEYKKTEYYAEHSRLYLFTEDTAYILRPIAGFVTPAVSESYSFFETTEALQHYLERCVAQSTFDSGIDPGEVDCIITLSTCDYTYDDARYVLVCQPVPFGE